ncbi:hypothetical protein [Lentibacter sp. XHP0401]|uniref:hypothetical protein n=1 Tax=Lentibacter sp. XHP0401 TaxID=2984334 RepID=UPI0021E98C53|nr:hypothetical protein [Lentibacter sp. XHP0401]MCV2894000.1 hypothetical protein [Lentibacter sp. XHP0401]
MNKYLDKGWFEFPYDARLARWVREGLQSAWSAVDAPENAHWHQCEGTWFVGVNALPNDAAGAVAGGGPLAGAAYEFAMSLFGALPLHAAQLSVVYAGYPKPRAGESAAAGRYRLKRDAAHLDGLKLEGETRERRMGEYHAWVLGIPLTESAQSPMVVWEGSHLRIAAMLKRELEDVPPARWHEVDLMAAYTETRAEIFEECQRVEVRAKVGEAYILHRFALHGVAPWRGAEESPRMIAYFRPELADRERWLLAG